MVAARPNTSELWQSWRRLYPVYCALSKEQVIDFTSSPELEEELDAPSAEIVADAEHWFSVMDERIRIHHWRQFAQTSSVITERVLCDLLTHILGKRRKTDDDRDKVDFTVVQLFSLRIPSRLAISDFGLEEAEKVLEPVLGSGGSNPGDLTKQLNELLAEAKSAPNLNSLFTARILERSRSVKAACGDRFFEPKVMAAFARFGFLIRRNFFRLMQQDLNSIFDGLRELEGLGVSTLDCRKAQFSAEEPISRIRLICQSWRVMFQAEYSSGQPLCLLVDLQTAVESARQNQKGGTPHSMSAHAGHKVTK